MPARFLPSLGQIPAPPFQPRFERLAAALGMHEQHRSMFPCEYLGGAYKYGQVQMRLRVKSSVGWHRVLCWSTSRKADWKSPNASLLR